MFIWNECVGVLTTIISFFFQFILKLLSTFWRGHIGWIRGKYQFYTICKYSKKNKKILLVLSHFFTVSVASSLWEGSFSLIWGPRAESLLLLTNSGVSVKTSHTHTQRQTASAIFLYSFTFHTHSLNSVNCYMSVQSRGPGRDPGLLTTGYTPHKSLQSLFWGRVEKRKNSFRQKNVSLEEECLYSVSVMTG